MHTDNIPIDRKLLKDWAKERIRTARPETWRVALVYLLATTVVTGLYNLVIPAARQMNEQISQAMNLMLESPENGYRAAGIISSLFSSPAGYIAIFFSIVLSLYTSVMSYGYTGYSMQVVRGGEPGYGELFSRFYMAGKIILAELLTVVYVTLWSMLFIIPGIIAMFRYMMVPYILLDDPDCSVFEAFRRSKALMRGRKWELFVLGMSFVLWELGASLTVGVFENLAPLGLSTVLGTVASIAWNLFLLPYESFTFAQWYDAIRPQMGTDPQLNQPPMY